MDTLILLEIMMRDYCIHTRCNSNIFMVNNNTITEKSIKINFVYHIILTYFTILYYTYYLLNEGIIYTRNDRIHRYQTSARNIPNGFKNLFASLIYIQP